MVVTICGNHYMLTMEAVVLRIQREHKAFKIITAGSLAFTIGIVASGVYALGNLRYEDLTFNSERRTSEGPATPQPSSTSQSEQTKSDEQSSSSSGLSVTQGNPSNQWGGGSMSGVQPASPMPTQTPSVGGTSPTTPSQPVVDVPSVPPVTPPAEPQPPTCAEGLQLINNLCVPLPSVNLNFGL